MWSKTKQKINSLKNNQQLEANESGSEDLSDDSAISLDSSCNSLLSLSPILDMNIKNTIQDESIELASKACEFAIKNNDYVSSVRLLSKAIELNGNDFRYYANRSYAFFSLKQFKFALNDAEMAIKLNSDNPIGLVRKAMSLNGLKRYNEAEIFAKMALKLDSHSYLAKFELLEARRLAFVRNGFDMKDIIKILGKCKSIPDGLRKLNSIVFRRCY